MPDPKQHQGRISRTRRDSASTIMGLAVMLAAAAVGTPSAQAQVYNVLYSFEGETDGANPWAGLLRDPAGNLYGVTVDGGGGNCSYNGIPGCGTLFKLDTAGNETVVYHFQGGSDGAFPYGDLVGDTAGNLYGTTQQGGLSNYGTVFKVDANGNETVLHSFAGAPDGSNPSAGLVRDSAGNLYGTTFAGGVANLGAVFKVDANGNETVRYSFKGSPDGENPTAGLLRDSAGNLYGTTIFGGITSLQDSWGTVFKLDNEGNETVLYRFENYPDGAWPGGGLVRDKVGNLYGTTKIGGSYGDANYSTGTIFKLDESGKETVLHSFAGYPADGGDPLATLLLDSKGNLYGTTYAGGHSELCIIFPTKSYEKIGCGTVFKLDPSGKEEILPFSGTAGIHPSSRLIPDGDGLSGTTLYGGPTGAGYGVVFKVTAQVQP